MEVLPDECFQLSASKLHSVAVVEEAGGGSREGWRVSNKYGLQNPVASIDVCSWDLFVRSGAEDLAGGFHLLGCLEVP